MNSTITKQGHPHKNIWFLLDIFLDEILCNVQLVSTAKKIDHAGIELKCCRNTVNRPPGFKGAQA
jgi:hypothetical protein